MYTRRHRTLHNMLTRYINRESYLKQGLKEQILTCLSEGKCFGGEVISVQAEDGKLRLVVLKSHYGKTGEI